MPPEGGGGDLDPALAEVIEWKQQQSRIVDLFVDEWLDALPGDRELVPYRLDLSTVLPERLLDRDGHVVARFRIHGHACYVEWLRSLEDLRKIDAAAWELRRFNEGDA